MNAFTLALDRAAAEWWQAVFHVTWQASLLAALLMGVVFLGRRWSSPLRYSLLLLALVKFALPPMISLPTGLFSNVGPVVETTPIRASVEAVAPREAIHADVLVPAASSPEALHPMSDPGGETTLPSAVSSAESSRLGAAAWLMLLHVCGSVAMGIWIILELKSLHGVVRRAVEIRNGELYESYLHLSGKLGLREAPRLLLSDEASGPAAFGLLSPIVLLPRAVTQMPKQEMDVILAHELAHHRRWDLWFNAAQLALGILWWFNPLLAVLNRQIRRVREDCCDDLLLTQNLTTGPAYCETLMHAASALAGHKTRGIVLGFGERLHLLAQRFERLMDNTLRRTGRLSFAGGFVVILLAGLVLPGLHRSAGSEPESEATPAPRIGPAPESNAQQPDLKEGLVIAGRVIDPNGKPVAGVKLYAMVKSMIQMPPKLKDPNTKIVEMKTIDGKQQVFMVHPGFIAIMKKHGLDPAKPVTQEMFTRPELQAEIQKLQQELYEENPYQNPQVQATSGPDGAFRFIIAKSWLKQAPHDDIEVYAFADGFGPGWSWASKDEELTDLTVRLVEDLPVKGRIVDLQGRGVPDVTVKLGSIITGPDGTLKVWQDFVKAASEGDSKGQNTLLPKVLERQMLYTNFAQIPKSVTTDKDGRFSIRGIGANRLLFKLEVIGPSIGHDYFSVVTAADTGIKLPGLNRLRPEYRTYPATFDHVVNPTRILAGTLRDKETGKPIEGVQVAAWGPAYVESFTDKNGHFELAGLSKSTNYSVSIWPLNPNKKPLPYMNATVRVADTPGLTPLTADVNLVRGVLLRGKVTQKQSGTPIGSRASIWYAAFKDNPHAAPFVSPKEAPQFGALPELFGVPFLQQTHTQVMPDGTFQMIVLPGKGLLGVHAEGGNFAPATLPEAEKDKGFWSKLVPNIGSSAKEFQGVKLIEVPEKATETTAELTVEAK
jgi:beta-lactamase regulating signal transducer with metallopeptidase domain